MNRIPSRERATRRPREGEKDERRVVLVAVKLDVDDDTEHRKREVEAIAYVVGRYCRLDTTASVFYLSAWKQTTQRSFATGFGFESVGRQN